MSGDVHVQFCERPGARFPGATHRNIYVRSHRAGDRVVGLNTTTTGGSCTNPVAAGKPAARHIDCGSVRFWFHERQIPKKGLDSGGGAARALRIPYTSRAFPSGNYCR